VISVKAGAIVRLHWATRFSHDLLEHIAAAAEVR
jgi:hypothetical protein